MTFKELEIRLGGEQNKADWHQHNNGGGWVHKNAQIADEAFIGEKAVVWQAWNFRETKIGKEAIIKGGTIWGGTIKGGTIEGGTIEGGTIKGGTIEGGTIKGGTIKGGTWKVPPLFIQGSRHSLTNAKPGYIMIGCKCATFAWWQTKSATDFGAAEGYDAAAVEEYKTYIDLFVKLGK